jgi:signal transduction histidine kinase
MRWYGSATNMDDYHQLQAQLAHTQKMEAIGQLTGGMAHDFNNVLTAVMGSADLLKETLDQQPELASLVDTIILAAEKGATLNRSLLAFARRQALDPVRTDITALICSMEAILRRTLPQRIDFQVALPEHALFARIDPAQLESTLLNLALNARDAMPAGGHLLVKAGLANEGPEETGRWVNIRFQDTGSGIPEDKINHIFEPFFTTKGEGRGSGLGLSMAFGFIKQSGGHINVQSKVNQGTTFDLYLPADEIPRTKQAPA